jgi:hypothetical protein
MQRDYSQAGSLRSALADAVIKQVISESGYGSLAVNRAAACGTVKVT